MSIAGASGGHLWRGALRHRNFRLFWFGQLISLVGTWMQQIAQAWLVLLLTGNPFWLGVVAAAQFLPVLVLGLFGGMIADLLPKRRTLVATQASAMVLAFALAVLAYAGIAQVWEILVLAALLGLVNAIDMPTRQSFVVEMVGREDVGNAVGLNSAIFNAARIIGPALGGVLIGGLGVAACFLVNGFSYLAVIGGLLLIREAELRPATLLARPGSVAEVRANLADGLGYVRRTPIVLLAVTTVGVISTVGMNFNVLIPPLAHAILGVGATGLGFLLAAMGVGSFVAALAVSAIGRPRVGILLGGAFVLGALQVVLAVVRIFPLALLAMFGAGAGAIAMMVSANTAIQLAVPDVLRGRVLSVYTTVFAGSTPFGALAMGWLASSFGTPLALGVGGLLSVLTAAAAAAWVVRGGPDSRLARPRAPEIATSAASPATAGIRPAGRPPGSGGS